MLGAGQGAFCNFGIVLEEDGDFGTLRSQIQLRSVNVGNVCTGDLHGRCSMGRLGWWAKGIDGPWRGGCGACSTSVSSSGVRS